jgi:hypothetical protein
MPAHKYVEKYKKMGVCASCSSRPPVPGSDYCQVCRNIKAGRARVSGLATDNDTRLVI